MTEMENAYILIGKPEGKSTRKT